MQDEYGPFKREDVVAAAPDPDDVREASKALAEKRAAAKAKKKAAKRAKAGVVDEKPEKKKRKAAPPSVGAAADIARQAKERTQQDHSKNPELGAMFHSDATNSKPDAATLFAATAPRRYNLN